MQPPVRSAPRVCRLSLDKLEIHVFMKKLSLTFLASPREMNTMQNVSRPSVSAPLAIPTFKTGPRPIPGNVLKMSLTP